MTDPARPLAGRVALVTGAARGIGRRIAVRLAAAGADVGVTSRDLDALAGTVEEIEAAGGRAAPCRLDLIDPAGADAAVAHTLERFGALDVVVANSGVGGPIAPLWEIEVDDWDATFDVNVRGTWLTLRAATRHMVAAGTTGSVVVIGSLTGKRPLVDRAPYVASKAALIGLVRAYATELGPKGIRANLVSPGFVAGERLDWVVTGQAQARGIAEEAVREELAGMAPLRRFVAPDDVAETVLFLAGDSAAGITGTDVNVTAGVVMY
ncbi:MAG: SDR family oxidoreductase [Actinobacteria bacterium]|nr:SDR family oxidoreductase [Actinomycetota bacterium]